MLCSKLSVYILLLCILGAFLCSVDAARRVNSFSLVNETEQRRQHMTTPFTSTSWIIGRRGGALNFRVNLDSALSSGQTLSLQVSPFAIFEPSSIVVNHVGGGTYDIRTRLANNAPVGSFSLGVRLSDVRAVTRLPRQIVVLFNPWNPLDVVHYPIPNELEEYILNEQGITYRGTSQQIQDVRWDYGQFTHETMLVILYLTNKLGEVSRRDPGLVARHLTACMALQETNPDGMMVGKWEGSFAGGQNPSAWSSSQQVIRSYIGSGMRPVRWVQCWIFGAVLQSLLRGLGVPTRQVAAFDCAHEKPERQGVYTQSLARYWDRNTRSLVSDLGAQIWNFHSFNEIWYQNIGAMAPYNLPEWHTVDGTPQEFSGDRMQLGPANVRAVREGRKIKHDVSFVTAEVSSRFHNYLVSCPFFFGRSNQLPPSCTIVQDMGPEPHWPTGTYIVAKAIRGFNQNPLTNRYHNRFTGGLRNSVRAFDVSSNAGLNGGILDKEFSEGNGIWADDDPDNVELVESVRGIGLHRRAETMGNMGRHRSRSHLLERTSDSGRDSIHHNEETGLTMGIVMPPVTPGEPIEIVINLGCKDSTADLDNLLIGTNNARRHIIMNAVSSPLSPQPTSVKCPERVLSSLRAVATFASHTGSPGKEIANVKSNVVLTESNSHFASLRLSLTNYASEGVTDNYVSVTVFATDHSSDVSNDIILFGSHTMAFNVPPVRVSLSSDHVVKGEKVFAKLTFTNPLPVPIRNAKLHISAENLGFTDLILSVGDLAPFQSYLHNHEFSTETATIGTHFYNAIVTSDNLIASLGERDVHVREV